MAQGGDEESEPRGWFRRPGRSDELAALRGELAAALDRAGRAERELAALAEAPDDGDGRLRAEQILELAQRQARETRLSAAREAAVLLERTHAEAETHRRAVADELAARSAETARRADEREAALDVREREIAEAAGAERREIAGMRAAAEAEADRIRNAVLVAVEDLRRRAVAEAMAEARRVRAVNSGDPPG